MSLSRKPISNDHSDVAPTNSTQSSQDWICIKCNNLNFSFRKRCNRCKVQTREDNHHAVYVDYYYYNHYYQYQNTNFQKNKNKEEIIKKQLHHLSPVKQEKNKYREEKQGINLPSVSPLVKKYKNGENKKAKTFLKNVWMGQSTQKIFGFQLWNNEQFQEVDLSEMEKQLSNTDDEEPKQDYIKSVQKMII